jgi:uncharacterized protein YndB with AHSA1/START domain
LRIEESVEIGRPPETVWAVVSDPISDPRWCSKVKSVRPDGEARWSVMHKPVPLRPAKELIVERLGADPPRRLTMREEDDVSVFQVEYRLEPAHGGTRFTQVSEFEWKRLPRLLRGTFARGVRRDVRRQLRALKRLVEG